MQERVRLERVERKGEKGEREKEREGMQLSMA